MTDGGQYGCGLDSTWPVCSKEAGNIVQGVCDLAGNVWEWVEDWYHSSYNAEGGAPVDGSAWVNPSGSDRAGRGGSWVRDARDVRAADRGWVTLGNRVGDLGARLCR
jgi:formylglycine-generating enzyme required for sulfatase activity